MLTCPPCSALLRRSLRGRLLEGARGAAGRLPIQVSLHRLREQNIPSQCGRDVRAAVTPVASHQCTCQHPQKTKLESVIGPCASCHLMQCSCCAGLAPCAWMSSIRHGAPCLVRSTQPPDAQLSLGVNKDVAVKVLSLHSMPIGAAHASCHSVAKPLVDGGPALCRPAERLRDVPAAAAALPQPHRPAQW